MSAFFRINGGGADIAVRSCLLPLKHSYTLSLLFGFPKNYKKPTKVVFRLFDRLAGVSPIRQTVTRSGLTPTGCCLHLWPEARG